LNNATLIRELRMMIQERKPSDYLIINGLIIISLFVGLKEYEECLKRNNATNI